MTSSFVSCVRCKCPACRKGDLFETGAFSLRFASMHKRCPNCNVMYEVEPGFFWGAMFVSYGFAVAIVITVWLFTALFYPQASIDFIATWVVILNVLGISLIFRWSRSIFLYLFSGIKKRS